MAATVKSPLPFTEAMKALARRKALPSSLDSAGLRQLGAAFHRQNFVSAQTLLQDLLDNYKDAVGQILNPTDVTRADRVSESNPEGKVQEGLDLATARMQIRDLQRKLGYAPAEDEAGTIKDLSSDKRIDLVVRTNTELAQGAGDFLRQNDEDVIDLFPAWELYRLEPRDKERDWEQRWRIAAAVAQDPKALAALELSGTMAALKSSGIWQALGDGEGGYMDTLGNPYPPFAFNSGMWTRELSRDEAEELGLIEAGQKAEVNGLDLGELFGGRD